MLRKSILTGSIIGVAFVIFVVMLDRVGDIRYSLCLARALRAGVAPYSGVCPIRESASHDILLAPIILLPFSYLPPLWGCALWSGISFGLLAGVLVYRRGEWGLLALLSFPAIQCAWGVQWYPLLTVVAFIPALMPLALGKPHIGLALGLWRFSPGRALACAVAVGLSLLIWPTWIHDWAQYAALYVTEDEGVMMALTPVGLILTAAAALLWKHDRARLVLYFLCVPIRSTYNLLPLFVLPETKHEMIWLVASSWVGLLIVVFNDSWYAAMILGSLAPALLMVALRARAEQRTARAGAVGG
ncbi:MAG: hypothetical protein HGB28_06045 [Oscillochloris sp.]|nr:hypothetical protein [Oscillochloris sp.]